MNNQYTTQLDADPNLKIYTLQISKYLIAPDSMTEIRNLYLTVLMPMT
jgi:hypothetical protein